MVKNDTLKYKENKSNSKIYQQVKSVNNFNGVSQIKSVRDKQQKIHAAKQSKLLVQNIKGKSTLSTLKIFRKYICNFKKFNKKQFLLKRIFLPLRHKIFKGVKLKNFAQNWDKKVENHSKLLQWVKNILRLKKKKKLSSLNGKLTKILAFNVIRNVKMDSNWFTKFRDKLKKKVKIDADVFLEKKQFSNSWERKKWGLLRYTPLWAAKKTKKRFKFYKHLRSLIRYPSLPLWSNTLGQSVYNSVPKKIFAKKLILIKKMLFYYYKLPFRKPISSLIRYSQRFKNKYSINGVYNFINILESKLCIFLMRLRYVSNTWESGSRIAKGHFLVNGVIVFEPGYILKVGDIVQWKNFFEYYVSCLTSFNPKRLSKYKFFWKAKTKQVLSQYFFNKNKHRFLGVPFIRAFFWLKFQRREVLNNLRSLNFLSKKLWKLIKKKKKVIKLTTKLFIFKFLFLIFQKRSQILSNHNAIN